jgi:hypothetical protein
LANSTIRMPFFAASVDARAWLAIKVGIAPGNGFGGIAEVGAGLALITASATSCRAHWVLSKIAAIAASYEKRRTSASPDDGGGV